jgi:hypothetical protein
MKVLTFSTLFPKGHPKAGQPTWFVEKVEACLADTIPGWEMSKTFTLHEWDAYYNCTMPKHHTIRAGNRWKVGDMASLRIWSGKPRRSKQIEFAQVEVKKTWPIEIRINNGAIYIEIDGRIRRGLLYPQIARNDGLEYIDFVNWFMIHPNKIERHTFTGQIICWSDKVDYGTTTGKPDLQTTN